MQTTVRISFLLTIGILILGLGVFASQWGLDPNPGLGRGRISLLTLGLIMISAPWVIARRTQTTRSDLFAVPALLLVIGIYFWFVTLSRDFTSSYYSLLATSFRNGELSLPLNPDPELLALPNPYDPAARQGIRVPVDLSLYNGKFYLYWGPAPSALLAVVQPFLPGRIGEFVLLFLFMCGIFLAQYLLIMYLWDRFFSHIPRWIVILSVFLAGLANPALWMLSQPKIYETAIAGAQFFFFAGLVSAILALDRQSPSRWGLALAGSVWALAVSTRSVALFPVVFMTGMVTYRLFNTYRSSLLRFAGELLPLGIPLLLGALGFAWYNWARFGSFLETGFTYQLAAPYLQQHMHELFLLSYIVQNLYNYMLNPFTVHPSFPFLSAIRGQLEAVSPWPALPDFYTAQAITGFLIAVPFLIFALLPVTLFAKQLRGSTPTERGTALSFGWIMTSLLGSFLLPFLSLLAFFWAAMRYAEDFMPALLLLSIVGFWQGYEYLSRVPGRGKIYATLGVTLAIVSVLSAVLLALSILYANGLLGN
ncbi:MAG TPA: hypothetical protein VK900_05910 [Anaerolineales bacterium]|nr:hypothetical protein [Anaerolineales bacterium]